MLHRPQFTDQEAVQIAQEVYGISGSVKSLPSERDQNYRLIDDNGRSYVLKIAGKTEARDILDYQNQALTHLRRQPDLAAYIPEVVLSKAGEAITAWPERAAASQTDGGTFDVRLLTYLPGIPLALVNPHSPDLLYDFGHFLGRTTVAFAHFRHPAMYRRLHWDMTHTSTTIRERIGHIQEIEQRALVENVLARFEADVLPCLSDLRRSVIHSDANDYNVLVTAERKQPRRIAGLIDFGDMVHSATIFELAIAAAYAMLDKRDPLAAAAQMVAGYHEALPLTELELALLFTLINARLATSVTMSTYQQSLHPDDPYLVISQKPAWAMLRKLAEVPPGLAKAIFRQACGLEPVATATAVSCYLLSQQLNFSPILGEDWRTLNPIAFDASVGSLELGSPAAYGDLPAAAKRIEARLDMARSKVGVGRYNEPRLIYTADSFRTDSDEWRTIHLGLDLFASLGTRCEPVEVPVFAPLPGKIHSFQDNDLPLDYGPTLILEHETDEGILFYTLYGHLSRASMAKWAVGKPVAAGEQIATLGRMTENGGWPPHLHFQLILDMLDKEGDFIGVAPASQRAVWTSICPDPNLILGIPDIIFPERPLSKQEILDRRLNHFGSNLSISYQIPLNMVRGWRQYLYDENGRPYLDAVNNVCHVGHSHPHVVKALSEQAYVLNTNTRYLHDNIVNYADRLLARFPPELDVCFFVCSGSEANELALRLARTHTGAEDMIVIDGAYHGNTAALIDISPYKHDGSGGKGAPPHIHKALMPDPYRGRYRGDDTGSQYAAHVAELIDNINRTACEACKDAQENLMPSASSWGEAHPRSAQKKGVLAGMIVEPVLGCGGQIVLPNGYLPELFALVRAAGGVCIADEVQVGFGRVGSHFWGFETQGVVPDIVTMGKPIGNGHPLAAVVTTREIADSFANGMEYFNTFGGNPVSCAVGMAVLDVIEQEGLQANAWQTGKHLLKGLTALMARHPIIGDVRGLGLFVGVELVRDRETLEPAAWEARYIVERMKDHGVLISIDGPLHNVLKLKPPIVFDVANADFLVEMLDKVLAEDAARV
ncbi:MAG: alanine--glyoxylate aminotransferase [Chloroflexi bacterium]|nr:MAG: alanine--glyoxylate aminotransferase [Chloroflexota bacterium]